jgi:hypothetical protein
VIVEEASGTWELPVAMLDADPSDTPDWLAAAHDSVTALLADRRPGAAPGLG